MFLLLLMLVMPCYSLPNYLFMHHQWKTPLSWLFFAVL